MERCRSHPALAPRAAGGRFRGAAERPDAIPNFITNVAIPELRVFRPVKPNGRSLLSIPGGAYRFVSIANEGVDVANAMTAKGYTVFVLVYRLPGEGWKQREDVPLQDAQRAVRLIREQSVRFGLDPNKLYAVGFSAGGHLAATLATGFAEPVYAPVDQADALSARPDGVGLIYPVISHVPGIGHAESSRLLLGENPSPQLVAKRSPALHVSAGTPPVFLMHAMDDPAVPVENSFLIIDALRAAGRPVEAHLFAEGRPRLRARRARPARERLDRTVRRLGSIGRRPSPTERRKERECLK
jgi:acetyl esterase/lipase